MKSTKTILAVAIVIAGLTYAVGSAHPKLNDSLTHSRCCGPQPEDFRSYYQVGDGVIIPAVEGENGMIITDVVCTAGARCKLYVAGEPITSIVEVRIINGAPMASVHLQTGIPVPVGTEISVFANTAETMVSGYVY